MKMTLSSPASTNTGIERQTVTTDQNQKSPSPSSSPRSSPRPSPRPQTKQEHNKPDTHLSVNYKEQPSAFKHEGSPSSHEGSISGCISSTDLTSPNESKVDHSSNSKDRKDPRGKKKSSWFNSFYPTYKSRSEDFKRTFKEVPDDERLVVDYSCALQKEILVHGRLYVTQNYLCFYANIFGWETNVSLKWKEVTSISKEKTALVIPNAVLISTRTDQKFFFTSLVARDKTYVMLFRVWQNALMDQPMSATEMWQWVHQSYGEELGLTSDDEDYIAPGTEEDKLSARSLESFSENECNDSILDPDLMKDPEDRGSNSETSRTNNDLQVPTDRSDTESDIDRPANRVKAQTSPPSDPNLSLPHSAPRKPSLNSSGSSSTLETDESGLVAKGEKPEFVVTCSATHVGRQLVSQIMPIHLDQLFTLLFTSSKFYLDFHASRKTTDLTQTPWTHNPIDNSKSRVINQTIALSNSMGPKTAQVTETQMMLPCSKAGYLYAIDVETVNAGVPYADSFVVLVHYCLKRISDTQSSISVHAQIKYKKSVWGLVKSMIEKNCWSGLDDFFSALIKALRAEAEEDLPEKRKSKRKKRMHSTPKVTEKSRISGAVKKKKTTCTAVKRNMSGNIKPLATNSKTGTVKILTREDNKACEDKTDPKYFIGVKKAEEDSQSYSTRAKTESSSVQVQIEKYNAHQKSCHHAARFGVQNHAYNKSPSKPCSHIVQLQPKMTVVNNPKVNTDAEKNTATKETNYAFKEGSLKFWAHKELQTDSESAPGRKKVQSNGLFSSDTVTVLVFIVLMVLVFLNVMLYMKLWSLEETPPYSIDLKIIQNLPKSHEEWIQLLQKQESLHTIEVKKWQKILKTAVSLLKQAEESLTELQISIFPASSKIVSIMEHNENSKIEEKREL